MELDITAELVFFETVQLTKLPESISQAENVGSIPVTPPRTDAGVRTIVIPQVIIPDLEQHLASVPLGADGLLFTTTSGAPMRRATLYTAWGRATRAVGITGLRFHDLHHTGNTPAAATGASTKELMARMGQSSPRAALIYQHATQDRDAAIAAGLSSTMENHRSVSSRRSAKQRRTRIARVIHWRLARGRRSREPSPSRHRGYSGDPQRQTGLLR